MFFIKQLVFIALTVLVCTGCYKTDISFGTDLGETFTTISQTDTVGVHLSTYVRDSFATNTGSDFLIGSFEDNFLGRIEYQPYFQVTIPSDITIEDNARFDSLTLVLPLNRTYTGDTTKPFDIKLFQLAEQPDYTYGTSIYNTSYIETLPGLLGSASVVIQPTLTDSIVIKLNDQLGADMFRRMQQKDESVSSEISFLQYFKGLTIQGTSTAPGAVYGFIADSIKMRVHYHTAAPLPQTYEKDFAFLSNGKSFNRMHTDRTNSALAAAEGKAMELSAATTGNRAFLQSSTGVLLKVRFPSLRNLLHTSSFMRLVKATLILRAEPGTYSSGNLQLPPSLYLVRTNGTNTAGSPVLNSKGDDYLTSNPITDPLYGNGTTYSFDVTNVVQEMLASTGAADDALFVMDANPGTSRELGRLVLSESGDAAKRTQLVLSILTLKNNQ